MGNFLSCPLYIKAREFIQPTNQNLQQAFQGNLFFKTGNGNFDQYSEQEIIDTLTHDQNRRIRHRVVESASTKVLDGNSRLNLFVTQSYKMKIMS